MAHSIGTCAYCQALNSKTFNFVSSANTAQSGHGLALGNAVSASHARMLRTLHGRMVCSAISCAARIWVISAFSHRFWNFSLFVIAFNFGYCTCAYGNSIIHQLQGHLCVQLCLPSLLYLMATARTSPVAGFRVFWAQPLGSGSVVKFKQSIANNSLLTTIVAILNMRALTFGRHDDQKT